MEWEFIVLDWFQSIQNPVLTKILGFVTMLGEAGWFWILLGVLLFISKKYRTCGVALLAASFIRPCFSKHDFETPGSKTKTLLDS